MIEAGALLVFGAIFILVAVVSERYGALIGIGGLLLFLGAARLLWP